MSPVVTFDVFSALVDSRTGGSALFASLGGPRSWPRSPEAVYDRWDAENKQLHRLSTRWRSFAELAGHALVTTYRELGLDGDPAADCALLLASTSGWPLWPDVSAESLRGVHGGRVGVLTNTDDALLDRTAVVRLGVFAPEHRVTSELLGAYKPAAEFYRRAVERLGPLVHVASSARDVRGCLEAGIPCVRLARPGHRVDPAGPQPEVVVTSLPELPAALAVLGAAGR